MKNTPRIRSKNAIENAPLQPSHNVDAKQEGKRQRRRGKKLDLICDRLHEIEMAKSDAINLLQLIDAGVLNQTIDQICSALDSSVENAYAALRGEPAA